MELITIIVMLNIAPMASQGMVHGQVGQAVAWLCQKVGQGVECSPQVLNLVPLVVALLLQVLGLALKNEMFHFNGLFL